MKNKLSMTCQACGQKFYSDKIYLGGSVFIRKSAAVDYLVLFVENDTDEDHEIFMDKPTLQNLIRVYEDWKDSDK